MTSQDFRRVFELAKSDVSFADVDDSPLCGYALPGFKPVAVTVAAAAKAVRWQALQFNGHWDQGAINELRAAFVRRVSLLD